MSFFRIRALRALNNLISLIMIVSGQYRLGKAGHRGSHVHTYTCFSWPCAPYSFLPYTASSLLSLHQEAPHLIFALRISGHEMPFANLILCKLPANPVFYLTPHKSCESLGKRQRGLELLLSLPLSASYSWIVTVWSAACACRLVNSTCESTTRGPCRLLSSPKVPEA